MNGRWFYKGLCVCLLLGFLQVQSETLRLDVPPKDSAPNILSKEDADNCDDLCQAVMNRLDTSRKKSGTHITISAGTNLIKSDNVELYGDIMIVPTIGIRAGTISFFNRYVGVRGFFGLDVGFGRYSGVLGMISLGIDAIAEFPLSKKHLVFMGGMLGIGADAYIYYDTANYNSFSRMRKVGEVFMQAGITTMLGKHNRINIIYRFLPARRAYDFSPFGAVMIEYGFKF